MSDREAAFHITIPAHTPPTAPLVTALAFDPGYVRAVHVTIPDGHAGLTGYALGYAGQQIVPNVTGVYIVSNDEKITHEFAVAFVGQQWSLVGYNNDVYDHTFHLRVEIDETPAPAETPVLPLTIEADTATAIPANIGAAGDVSGGDTSIDTAIADVLAEQP